MFVLNLSQKMINVYKLKRDKEIPNHEDKFPLWNWYVKVHVVNRKRYVLFFERDHYLCVWAEGVTSKNIVEVFKNSLMNVLDIAGISQEDILKLEIPSRNIYFSKTSDKIWIGVSNQVVLLSEQNLLESENTTGGLKPLIFYQCNECIYGAPSYKKPEDEIRNLFGLERRKFRV